MELSQNFVFCFNVQSNHLMVKVYLLSLYNTGYSLGLVAALTMERFSVHAQASLGSPPSDDIIQLPR